jgi:hypothetical protein
MKHLFFFYIELNVKVKFFVFQANISLEYFVILYNINLPLPTTLNNNLKKQKLWKLFIYKFANKNGFSSSLLPPEAVEAHLFSNFKTTYLFRNGTNPGVSLGRRSVFNQEIL